MGSWKGTRVLRSYNVDMYLSHRVIAWGRVFLCVECAVCKSGGCGECFDRGWLGFDVHATMLQR